MKRLVLCGPYSFGASRQRKPFLMMKMIPLMIRRSSTLGTPCDKMRLDPAHLRLRQTNQITHGGVS
jgi:hypothetical protein